MIKLLREDRGCPDLAECTVCWRRWQRPRWDLYGDSLDAWSRDHEHTGAGR